MKPPHSPLVARQFGLRATRKRANQRPQFLCALVVLSCWLLAACSPEASKDPQQAATVFSLADVLTQSTASRTPLGNPSEPALAPQSDAQQSAFQIVEIARGIAKVSLLIDLTREKRFETQKGVHVAWPLPFPGADTVEAGRINPRVEMTSLGDERQTNRFKVEVLGSLTIPMFASGKLPAPRELPILWIEGDWLHFYARKYSIRNAKLKLTYPVHAARLAALDLALPKATPLDELLLGRDVVDDGLNTSFTSMWLESGTQLELNLTGFPGGRLRGRLAAKTDDKAAPSALQLDTVELESGKLDRQVVSATGQAIELVLPSYNPGQRVTLSAIGTDGALLRLEQAHIESAQPLEHPNVLLIIVDTLRADRLGSFGSTLNLSPNLDALASESMIFSDYWATSSWTLPTISTMLTSVHTDVHGGKDKQSPINPKITTLAKALNDAGYRTEAITEGGLFRSVYNLDRGYEHFVEHQQGLAEGVQLANQFFDERATNEPWFLTLHSYEVHEPYSPDPKLIAQIRASLPPEMAQGIERPTDFIEFFESGEWDQVLNANVPALMEELHNAEVAYADFLIGKLLDRMRADGLLENTLVVLTADHGEEFGEHGMLGHGDSLYPELLHIPLIVRFPDGYAAGQVVEMPTSQLCLTPTILDAVGLNPNALAAPFQGTSLLRAGQQVPLFASRYSDDGDGLFAIRDGDALLIQGKYKFERTSQGTADIELYALNRDPGAQVDLDVSDPDRLEAMRALLESLHTQYAENAYSGQGLQFDAATQKNLAELGYL